MHDFATGPDGLIRTADYLRAGRNDRDLRRAVAAGGLASVIPGVFVDAAVWSQASSRERLVLRARAVAPRLRGTMVFSHETAAAIHGWDHLGAEPELVDVSDPALTRTRRGRTVRFRAFAVDPVDRVIVDGLPVTSPGRTAVDLAADQTFRQSVVAIDSALRARRELDDPRADRPPPTATPLGDADLDAALGRRLPVRSHAQLEHVRAFVDGRSGSAGESLSRVVMHELGLPAPVLQQPFFGPPDWRDRREKIGEVDFWWRELGVVGEFDGKVKYSRNEYLQGRSPFDAAVAEKRREDRIRALGEVRGFVRWMWADVLRPGGLASILAQAGVRR